MSSKANHRRGHGRVQERGPRYENADPAAGCNSTHVARSRAKWKKRAARAERRTGAPWKKHFRRRTFEPLKDALVDTDEANGDEEPSSNERWATEER